MEGSPAHGQGCTVAALPASREERPLRINLPAVMPSALAANDRQHNGLLETRGSDSALPSDQEPGSSDLTGSKRKSPESEVEQRSGNKLKKVAGPRGNARAQATSPSASANTQVSPELLALAHEIQKAAARSPLAFNNPDLLQKQLQAIVELKQQEASSSSAGQHSQQWLAGLTTNRQFSGAAALSLDSNASGGGGLHRVAHPSAPPPSVPPVITLTDVSRQGPAAAAALAAAAASSKAKMEASEGGERSSGKGTFLVQQPSSKLWMEAVPMRTGTKASNLYRVYSNAFMEGRPHEVACGYMRSGIPSIQSTASARPAGLTPASLASWARTHHLSKSAPPMERQQEPPQPQHPQTLKQHHSSLDTKGPVLAAAERILQRGCFLRGQQAAGGADDVAEVEGHQGSASSSDEHPPRASAHASPRDRVKHTDAVQKEAALQKQEQQEQMAALLRLHETGAGFPSASLLNAAGAQGSSNLIYILRSLQGRGSAATFQPLLQQLQAAQNSPKQHAIFMKMLQETLALPPGQATTTAAAIAAAAGRARDLEASGHASADLHGQSLTGPRHNSLLEAWRQSAGVGSTGDPEVPPFGKPRAPPARVPHEAALQRMASGPGRLSSRPSAGGAAEPMHRLRSDPLEQRPRTGRGTHSQMDPSQETFKRRRAHEPALERDSSGSAGLQRLVFKEPGPDRDRLHGLNPFDAMQTPAADKAATKQLPSRSSGVKAEGRVRMQLPEPAILEIPPDAGSEPKPKPETSRDAPESLHWQAVETLLCLNTTPEAPPQPPACEPEEDDGASLPEDVVDAGAPNEDAPVDAIAVSPLQALVQDIMQQQKKRAQDHAMASLPTGAGRAEKRASAAVAAAAHHDGDRFAGHSVRRRGGRSGSFNWRKETAAVADHAEELPSSAFARPGRGGGAGRHSVLGFAVPSAKRSGLTELPMPVPPQRSRSTHSYRGIPSRFPQEDVVRRRSSGESSGPSNFGEGFRRGDHIAKPGSAAAAARPGPNVVGRSMSGRRITRPATLDDSGGEYTEGSYDANSDESGSWDNSKEKRRRRRF